MDDAKVLQEARKLIAEHRTDCLWFIGDEVVPEEPGQVVRLLRKIELRADRATYLKARRLRECLSRISSAPSAGS
jgi:hypothetical protein